MPIESNNPLGQILIFFILSLSGFLVGFFYDIFEIIGSKRIKSKKTKSKKTTKNKIVSYLFDLFFSIIAFLITITSIFLVNNGELRWFEFCAITVGIIIYSIFLSKYVVKILIRIFIFLRNVVHKLHTFISWPFNTNSK